MSQLAAWAAEMGVPVYAALQVLAEAQGKGNQKNPGEPGNRAQAQAPFSKRATGMLLAFGALIEGLICLQKQVSLLEFLDQVLERTGYAAFSRDSVSG